MRKVTHHRILAFTLILMTIQHTRTEFIQRDITNTEIITTLENKKLHPLITSYSKIIDIIKNSTTNRNKRMTSHEILRQITETIYTEIDEKLVIKITIPILETEEYTLFRPFLIPYRTKTGYEIFHMDTEYLAVNTEKTHQIELHTNDVEKGKMITDHIETSFILLKHTEPIMSNQNSHCILNLFLNPQTIPSGCQTMTSPPLNTIIKLSNPNIWLYSIPYPTSMIIQCGKNQTKLKLVKEGTLTFLSTCKVSTKEFTVEVQGQPTYIKIDHMTIPPFSREEYSELIKYDTLNLTELPKLKLINGKTYNKDFLQENKKINQLQEMANKIKLQPHESSYKDKFNLITISSGSILITMLFLFIYYIKRTEKKIRVNVTNNHRSKTIEENVSNESQSTNTKPIIQGIRVI